MIRLMELGTSLKDPDTLKLEHPEHWDKEIKLFVQATETTSIEELRKVRRSIDTAGTPAECPGCVFAEVS